jgi:hypothetical protein
MNNTIINNEDNSARFINNNTELVSELQENINDTFISHQSNNSHNTNQNLLKETISFMTHNVYGLNHS